MNAPAALDRRAVVTRSLLGWGVVAGPFYVLVSLLLAYTRPGFDLTAHALSLLTLGEFGWLQRANLILTGLMVIAAAVGIVRAIRSGRGLAVGSLVGVYGACVLLGGVFVPDPSRGFPPEAHSGSVTISGILHLLCGGVGFVAAGAAALIYTSWSRSVGDGKRAAWSAVLGCSIIVGFGGGAALATTGAGVALLWVAVLAAFSWTALATSQIYAWSPHPLLARR